MAQNGDVLVAVMGVTGAGKSTFINDATGRTAMKVGTGLHSC
jgi:putative ribosome biogenesis GTPase RsgA